MGQSEEGGEEPVVNLGFCSKACFTQSIATPAILSPRESQVLQLLANGCLYKEIAGTLEISLPTVNTHTRRIYAKLRVRSRSQAVAKCLGCVG